MNKTIGLFAHVDAGKTTFAEQILYNTKSIRTIGRVDHKDSFLDSNSIEKERGITVFSDQAVFQYNFSTYYLIDTPGHMDFSSEMERAIEILDYAILIISAADGIQSQTEIVWQLLRSHNIPTFFFINKMDREGADIQTVIKDIKSNLTEDICFISKPIKSKKFDREIAEFIAERNDVLVEKYIEEDYEDDIWLSSFMKMIADNKVFPCMSGSALQNIGIDSFLENLDQLTFTRYNAKDKLSGFVYKIRHDEQRNKLAYIKILSGTLKIREEIAPGTEKISEMRIYNGMKFKNVDRAAAGQLIAVKGMPSAYIGCGIGNFKGNISYKMIPTLKSKVLFDESLNSRDVLKYFNILEEEDPSLKVIWNEKLQEIQITIMGIIQIEVLKEFVHERFDMDVDFGPCEILYKETIMSSSYGCGHFEPLRHYAEVYLKLEPGQRNVGITFKSQCNVDTLGINYQKLIQKHIYAREHHGILTGSPVTDLNITLVDGRSHIKHTCGGDFREATFRAIRQGLENAQNILLEPFYRFNIKANVDYMGRILSDIQRLNGVFETPEISGNTVIIEGRGPVAALMNYSLELTSFTKGKGKISMVFDGYDICHNGEEIVKKIGYNKNSDIEYTSSSVFCSKGQPFLVEGKDVERYMHCLK
ncbi:elongation factor G [Clostridium tyrobutyricum]|uniref:elongation factor G n=1 Tax=Clostridium tyrobutyricum TaxID=1519 RepID=UPI00057F3C30|nr:TetM/TetW/TetO/TetS family tetracycline resistance ribosomal protection protein [Clostridium tyrobutyricum]